MTTLRCTDCGHTWTTERADYISSFNAHRCQPTSWETAAIEAVKTLAATGKPFTIFECEPICGAPENPKAAWGRLAAKAHRLGLVERLGYQQGTRPTVKHSAVALWIGVTSERTGTAA